LRISVGEDQFWGIAHALESLAIVAATQQDRRAVYRLAAAAVRLRRTTKTRPYPYMARQLSAAFDLPSIEGYFGENDFHQAEWQAMTFDESVTYALTLDLRRTEP
jgi:hypothetical protein